MAWKECDRVSQRQELMTLAAAGGLSVAELARRFGVSRKTVYKWMNRQAAHGSAGLTDQSRRPRHSPHRTPDAIQQQVLSLHQQHPAWGGRKLHHRLRHLGLNPPAPSTITRILQDHRQIIPSARRPGPWQRFERALPNELWQMDFKSPVPLVHGGQSHPLTVVDDHSRYALALEACPDQKLPTVQKHLTRLFEHYGLPWAMLSDNGSPFRSPGYGLTALEVWLMRLDVQFIHGRPYHPQTQGKDERFHRTVGVEVLQGRSFADAASLQEVLDPWRQVYNNQRPHESLDHHPPASRYRPSVRSMPAKLACIEYDAGDEVRRVDASGQVFFKGRRMRVGKALTDQRVALRPTLIDGLWQVYYSRFRIGQLDLKAVAKGQFTHVLRSADENARDSH